MTSDKLKRKTWERFMPLATKIVEEHSFDDSEEQVVSVVLDSVLKERFIGGRRYFVSDDDRYRFAVIDEETLKDRKWTFYGWLDNVTTPNGVRTAFKFGEALRNSVYNRYRTHTGAVTALDKVIVVWDVPVDEGARGLDYELVHKHAHHCCARSWEKAFGVRGHESYFINEAAGVINIIKYIDGCLGKAASFAERIEREDYEMVKDDVNLIAEYVKSGVKNFLCNFFMRYGKTGFVLRNLRESDNRVAVVAYYIHTVAAGFQKEIETIKHNENICWVDAKWSDAGTVAEEWLKKDPTKKVVIGLPLTSGSDADTDIEILDEGTYARRVASVKKILKGNKCSLFIDEADYGADKIRQKKKIDELRKLVNFSTVMVMTGTNAFESAERIFEGETYLPIVRPYAKIMKSRPDTATKVDWYIIMNDCLPRKIRNKFDLENWETIFEIDRVTGRFVGEEFIKSFLTILFNPRKLLSDLSVNQRRVLALQKKMNPYGLNLIFGPTECEKMALLKKLIEEVTDKRVVLLNGDNGVTCAEAEEIAERAIASVKSEGGRLSNIVFIADKLVFRSWSVKEVKNVIMMCNGGNSGTTAQKVGRVLTPWVGVEGDTPEMARIRNTGVVVDYMFPKMDESSTNAVIQYMGRTSVLEDPSQPIDFCASFYIYCSDESNGFVRKLTQEEMEYMLCEDPETIRYTTIRIAKYLINRLDVTEKGRLLYFKNRDNCNLVETPSLDDAIYSNIMARREKGLYEGGSSSGLYSRSGGEGERRIDDGSDESIKTELINWVYVNRGLFSSGDETYKKITDEFVALNKTPNGRAKYEDICERENRDYEMVSSVFELFSNLSCCF